MKISRRLLLIAILPLLLAFSFAAIELYTYNQIVVLAEKTAQQTLYGSGWTASIDKVGSQPNPVYLGGLLYANIHSQNPNNGDWWAAGDYTSDEYKNGWRSTLANNPRLAHMAIQKFALPFFQEFDKALIAKKDGIIAKWGDGPQRATVLNQFSRREFWAEQRKVMERYEKLTNGLLALNDAQLNSFVTAIPDQLWKGNETTDLQRWLVDNGHITKTPQEYKWGDPAHMGAWTYDTYPVDLIFLTHRVTRDYPDWTPRKFLEEAKKFAYTAKTKLPR